RHDDIDLGLDQLRCVFLELLGAQSVTVPIDGEVAALAEAEPPELVEEGEMMRRVARGGVHAADSIDPSRLLRARGKRARRRAADKRHELAPSHAATKDRDSAIRTIAHPTRSGTG